MSTLLYEHMLRIEANGRICRIWREIHLDNRPAVSNDALKEKAQLMLEDNVGISLITATLAGHEFVNSVEVIDKVSGDGVCVHKDWP